MSSPSQVPADSDARRVYGQRLSSLESEQVHLRQRDRLFGLSKVVAATVAVVAAIWLARQYPNLLAWALVPALIFVVLWIAHERLLRTLAASTRLQSFYRRGLARLDDHWAGHGDTGVRFLDPTHLYARDLDIFGSGGLYELISQAASAPGQHTLANWLLHPAEPDEIPRRQEAVRELAPRLDLREQLALAADAIHEGTPEALTRWAESTEATVPGWLLYVAPPLAPLWLGSLFYWIVGGPFTWFALLTFLNATLTTRFIGAVKRAAVDVLQVSPLLGPLHRVLAVYESQAFHAPSAHRTLCRGPQQRPCTVTRDRETRAQSRMARVQRQLVREIVQPVRLLDAALHACHRELAPPPRQSHARLAFKRRRLRGAQLACKLCL